MPNKRNVVAIIDDNLSILGAMSRLLSELGYRTELYASAKEFLDAALLTEAHCLIVDIQLGESCGIELAQQLTTAGIAIPIIFMTANNSERIRKRVAEIGCFAILIKPFSANALTEALAKLAPRRIVGCEQFSGSSRPQ
jgi:FixJ family two-component response regulator